MSTLYLTSVGAGQTTYSATTSSIGYGSSGVLTINSTTGVTFCNGNGAQLGGNCNITSNGKLNCTELAITETLSCKGLTITSGGSITCLGSLICSSPLNMNNNAITGVTSLGVSSLEVNNLSINTLSVNSAAWNCNSTDSNSYVKSIWIVPNCSHQAYNSGTRPGDYGIFWKQYITNNFRSGLVIAGHASGAGVNGGIRVSGGVPLHVFGGSVGSDGSTTGSSLTEFYFGTTATGGKVQLIGSTSAPSTAVWSSSNVLWTYFNVGIYSEGHIVSSNYVVSSNTANFSDNRIKTNIVDIDDVSAMATLRLIEPKKYNYIDTIRRGTEPVWGFIAQQVRSVLPYSTTFMQKEIPNIYDLGSVASDMITITLSTKSTTLFQRDPSDNLFPIYLMGCDNVEIKTTITSIIDDKTFTIADPLTSKQITDLSQIFVYGSIVNDFHILDKNAIFTIATAALQELDREYQATRLEVASLTTLTSNMGTEIASLTSQNASLTSQVATLNTQVSSLISQVELLLMQRM